MQTFRILLVLAVLLGLGWIAWSFRTGNAGVIDLDLVWVRLPGIAVWQALLVALSLGVGLGAIAVGFAWLRQRILNRRYRRAIERLEGEIHELRSLPVSGNPGAAPEGAAGRVSYGQG